MKPEVVRDFFNQHAADWDDKCVHDPDRLQCIIDAADLTCGQDVIDVACGTGVLFPLLLSYDPARLLGVDISEEMVKIASDKFEDERLCIRSQDFLMLEESGFDRLVLHNAYPHFFDKKALARKMGDVLKKSGRFVVAHSHSRAEVNLRHQKQGALQYSTQLAPADVERKWFEPWFKIDKIIDTDVLYIISGIKE